MQKQHLKNVLLTDHEYEQLNRVEALVQAQAQRDSDAYNAVQAEEYGGVKSKALFQSEVRGMQISYIPVDGADDTYEIAYTYHLWIYALQTNNPGGKDITIPKSYSTGIKVIQVDDRYISTNRM